ncbi:MAG: hypothetical protein Q9212_005296 [Teloschistes hypoglaucus]
MDLFLGQITHQAMNYAVRSGIAITATYAIKQSSRLLKTVEGNEKEELEDLQDRLDSKIKIISPAIDMIELMYARHPLNCASGSCHRAYHSLSSSARGNTSLESAVTLTKSLRWDIQALGQRLASAATTDERARTGKLKAQDKAQHELELKRVIQSIKKLLGKIEDAVPLINLAITASGTSLSSTLPTTVSPSRLLQASTFLTAGDSQYSLDPSQSVQIGPTFTLSMYMLFSGHIRPQFEEDIRESTWKEVMHKANVKLMRVALDAMYDLPGEKATCKFPDGTNPQSPSSKGSKGSKKDPNDYFSSEKEDQERVDEYAYQLVIVEDLEDDRVHTFEDDEPQPGSFGDVNLAGIREALPVHEISKIFYADTGKILNIGTEGEVNSPILLLKRDINAIPPRRMMQRQSDEPFEVSKAETHIGRTKSSSPNAGANNRSQPTRLGQESISTSTTSTPRKGMAPAPTSNPWRIPLDLDPEWMAFEVYVESENSDDEPEPDASSKPSRGSSVEPSMTNAMSRLQLKPSPSTSSPSHPASSRSQTGPQLSSIRTSLSLLETILRLLSLQQFQQIPHLSIPDELLNFFLSESASTGATSGDIDERKRVRDDARRRVGFDPYDESPIKRRGEEYQYRNHQDAWEQNGGHEGPPYTPATPNATNGRDSKAYDSTSYASPGYDYPSPSSKPGRSPQFVGGPGYHDSPSFSRSKSVTPSSVRGGPGTPPMRWRPAPYQSRGGVKEGSPLARPPTGFADEGLGSSPTDRTQSPQLAEEEGKDGKEA